MTTTLLESGNSSDSAGGRTIPTVAFFITGVCILATQLLIDKHGYDSFRQPKELVFRLGALALAGVFVWALTAPRPLPLRNALREPATLVALLAVAWTAITTLTSTNRAVSTVALITVAASAVLLLGVVYVMRGEGLTALDFILTGAVVNAVFALLQELRIWQPFDFNGVVAGHSSTTALIGNPNDLGSYLVTPAIAAAIATASTRGWRRIAYVLFALILFAGLLASGTRTAIIAYVVALTIFAAMRSLRSSFVVAALVIVTVTFALSPRTPLGKNARMLAEAVRNRQFNIMFSQRLPAFLAAVEMARSHPLTGVGPGCYSFNYMHYRIALDGRYPAAWLAGAPEFFGQTHNDHLEVLAETGVVGYTIFLGALVLLAAPWARRRLTPGDPPTARFARDLRFPLAAGIAIVTLAQFPLELAAPRLVMISLAGLVLGWDRAA